MTMPGRLTIDAIPGFSPCRDDRVLDSLQLNNLVLIVERKIKEITG
jgi:hypothetical protein